MDRKWNLLVNGLAASRMLGVGQRVALLRRAGLGLDAVDVRAGVLFEAHDVTIGAGAFINEAVEFRGRGAITLEGGVYVATGVAFLTTTHALGDADRRAAAHVHAPIHVGHGTWIGARATILPGVTIGPGCVIGAGAVVRADCAPHGVYAGVPARRVRDLDPGEAPALSTR